MKRQPLNEVEQKVLGVIVKYPGCNILDLRNLLERSAIYDVVKILVGRKMVSAGRFSDETDNRYYPISQKTIKKRKPVLTRVQLKIVRAIKNKPGSNGWQLRRILNGRVALSNPWYLPWLIKRGLIKAEPDKANCRCYYAR